MENQIGIGDNIIIQVAIAVKDIEKIAKRLADIFQLETPAIFDGSKYYNEYMGKPTKSYTKTCYFKMGQLDLELIEPFGDEIAAGAFLKNKGVGIHHISFSVKDIEKSCAYLEKKGLETIQKTKFPGGKAAFVSIPEIGFDFELLEGESKAIL